MANTFKNIAVRNVGTSAVATVVASIPTQVTVIGMTVANTSASPITVDVYVAILGTNYYLVKGALIPVGGSLVPIGGDQKLVLTGAAGPRNDTLYVVSSAATSADVIVSFLEIS